MKVEKVIAGVVVTLAIAVRDVPGGGGAGMTLAGVPSKVDGAQLRST
jgi:hypothetical protein